MQVGCFERYCTLQMQKQLGCDLGSVLQVFYKADMCRPKAIQIQKSRTPSKHPTGLIPRREMQNMTFQFLEISELLFPCSGWDPHFPLQKHKFLQLSRKNVELEPVRVRERERERERGGERVREKLQVRSLYHRDQEIVLPSRRLSAGHSSAERSDLI